MVLKINGKHVFYSAIESLHYCDEKTAIICRTVSGMEYRKKVHDVKTAEQMIETLSESIAICSR